MKIYTNRCFQHQNRTYTIEVQQTAQRIVVRVSLNGQNVNPYSYTVELENDGYYNDHYEQMVEQAFDQAKQDVIDDVYGDYCRALFVAVATA